jgi:hypothetical protein
MVNWSNWVGCISIRCAKCRHCYPGYRVSCYGSIRRAGGMHRRGCSFRSVSAQSYHGPKLELPRFQGPTHPGFATGGQDARSRRWRNWVALPRRRCTHSLHIPIAPATKDAITRSVQNVTVRTDVEGSPRNPAGQDNLIYA